MQVHHRATPVIFLSLFVRNKRYFLKWHVSTDDIDLKVKLTACAYLLGFQEGRFLVFAEPQQSNINIPEFVNHLFDQYRIQIGQPKIPWIPIGCTLLIMSCCDL